MMLLYVGLVDETIVNVLPGKRRVISSAWGELGAATTPLYVFKTYLN
jgi:hypothetical protein